MSTPWVVVICLAVFVALGIVLSARPDLLLSSPDRGNRQWGRGTAWARGGRPDDDVGPTWVADFLRGGDPRLGRLLDVGRRGWPAATSYLAGLAAATAIFQISVAAVRRASDASPSFGVVVAMTTYLTVVVLMAAIAALLSPRLVDGHACAAGLVVAAVLGVAQQYRAARPNASN